MEEGDEGSAAPGRVAVKLFQSCECGRGLQWKHRSQHGVREAGGGGGPEKKTKPDEQIKVAFDGQGWPKEGKKRVLRDELSDGPD